MSDSEDEGAFQSADEGDEAAAKAEAVHSPKSKADDKTEQQRPVDVASKKKQDASQGKGQRRKHSKGKKATKEKSEIPVETEPMEEVKSEKTEVDGEKTKPTDSEDDKSVKLNKSEPPQEQLSEEPMSPENMSMQREVTPAREGGQNTEAEEGEAEGGVNKRQDNDKDLKEVMNRLAFGEEEDKPKASGWGWGSWGSSLLTTATNSVTTFTHQVGEGFTTVLETVESSLGAPDPEDLVRQDHRDAMKVKEPSPNGQSECSQEEDPSGVEDEGTAEGAIVHEQPAKVPEGEKEGKEGEGEQGPEQEEEEEDGGWLPWSGVAGGWGIGSGITKVTKAVEQTGKSFVTGSLDVLETIGKKTYDVLAEGDHGLKNTIRNTASKPNLSQTLREAQQDYEDQNKIMEEYEEARKAHFGSLFDEYNGLVHLEALELVSNQCEGKVQSLLGAMDPHDVELIKEHLIALKDIFQVNEDEEEEEESDENKDHAFSQLIRDQLVELGIPTTGDQLIQTQEKARHWLTDCAEEQQSGVKMEAKETHKQAIQTLAELTSCSMQQFHKVAQLLQMNPSGPFSVYKAKAECLKRLMEVLGTEVDILSFKFTACLNTAADVSEDPDSVNPLITNAYLEATNSKTYIQDAFQLLLPVVQHTALTAHSHEES